MSTPWREGSVQGAAALFLVGAVLYGAQAAALRLLPDAGRSARWAAAAVLGCWAAICAFHLLSSLVLFRLPAALGLAAMTAAMVGAWSRVSVRRLVSVLADDARCAALAVRGGALGRRRLGRIGLVALVGSVVGRAVVLPPLGWDTMTYHAVKAGLWVQSGGQLDLALPGFWADYRYFPPGGSILAAWAMLPFGDDLPYLWVDVVMWLGLGAVLHALARLFKVSAELRFWLIGYLLTVPGVYFLIGSGYIDVTLHLLLLAGLLFLLRALEGHEPAVAIGLWLLAWGTAQTVKVTVLPLLALAPLFAVAVLRRHRAQRRGIRTGIVLGSLGAAAALGPIVAVAIRDLGHPLSPFPARIAGLELGRIGESLELLRDTPGWSWTAELNALFRMFGGGSGASLGPLAIVAACLGVLGARQVLRRRPLFATAGLLFGLASAVPYFSPSYASNRVMLASQLGRFLYPMVVVLAMFAAARLQSMLRPNHRRVLGWLVVATIAATVLTNWVANASVAEWPAAAVAAILVAASPWLTGGLRRIGASVPRPGPLTAIATGALLALLSIIAPLRSYRDSLRYELLTASRAANDPPTYWVPLARAVDHPERSERIAIAGGPDDFPTGFYYMFLGRRLQNRLAYVPTSRSGAPPTPWAPGAESSEPLDRHAWRRRLDDLEITYVASLLPPGPEIEWMLDRPAEFRWVAGDPSAYGLWRVSPGSGAEDRPAESAPDF